MAKSDTEQGGTINAIIKAAHLSALDLTEKIDAYWTQNLRKEHAFDVRIEGDSFLPRFIALKQRFKQMPGIENMQPKEMGSNYAVMQVFYKGKSSQFANAVMLKTINGLSSIAALKKTVNREWSVRKSIPANQVKTASFT